MRSWPPLQTFAVLVALALLAIPTFRLTETGRAFEAEADIHPNNGQAVPAVLQLEKIRAHAVLRFAHPPDTFSLKAGEEMLWEKEKDAASKGQIEFQDTLMLSPVDGYIDLAVEVVWPGGTSRTVVELELIPDGSEAVTRTAWGEGRLETIFTMPLE